MMADFPGTVLAVGGGKGGVGKSVVAANLSCALALAGYKVILVDADLAGSNLHTLFGIRRPARTLNDYVIGKAAAFEDVLLPAGVDNLSLVCGATEFLELADPGYPQKQKLIRGIAGLRADYIVIDIGAGATANNIDFFNLADIGIVVTTPAPTAILNAYEFLKLAVRRKLIRLFEDSPRVSGMLSQALGVDSEGKAAKIDEVIGMAGAMEEGGEGRISAALAGLRYRLIVNQATDTESGKVLQSIAGVVYRYLNVRLAYLGSILPSEDIEKSVRAMTPVILADGAPEAAAFFGISRRIVAETFQPGPGRAPEPGPAPPHAAEMRFPDSRLCLNDEVARNGRTLHVQTEDLGGNRKQILSLVFWGGQIIFSRPLAYSDFLGGDDPRGAIPAKVRWLHGGILSGIHAGKLDDKIATLGG